MQAIRETTMKTLRNQSRANGIAPMLAMLIGLLITLALNPVSAADSTNPIVQNAAAPELVGSRWVNTPHPITLASLKGKVTILHFWTYGCINCRRNIPAYNHWQKQFAGKDVALIGVHTPETPGEALPARVKAHIRDYGITYPVLVDSKNVNWNRWNQQFWPTIYLLDKQGRIRYRWEGELEYDGQKGTQTVARLVDQLLAEN